MCLAIPGPFAALAPFGRYDETLPRSAVGLVIGLVNAFGNVGGFAGQYFVGWLARTSQHRDSVCGARGRMLCVRGTDFPAAQITHSSQILSSRSRLRQFRSLNESLPI